MIIYFENFLKIQLIFAFLFLIFFLVYRRSHLIGLLGFSDHSLNYMTEVTLEEEQVKKREKETKTIPEINSLRVGYFVPTQTGFMQ